ncbi:MAG: DUF4388 domain-containing protein [Myxococcales bacterium]|nr:DUF4388 domain-containing protein [Myxococcales bacterium]
MEHARTTNVLVVGDFARKAGISEAALRELAPRARLMRTVLKSEVLHLLSTTPVDLILAVSGPLLLATEDLARAMNSLPLPIPILVVSQPRDREQPRRPRPGEVVEHMLAPVEVLELQARVSALLAARAQLIRIEGVSLAGFVQLVEMERRSCTLFVASAERRGVLAFVDGKLVDAHSPEQEGDAAALEIFAWPHAIFAFHRNVSASATTVRRRLTDLLLDAARLGDEQLRDLARRGAANDLDFSDELFEAPANTPDARRAGAVASTGPPAPAAPDLPPPAPAPERPPPAQTAAAPPEPAPVRAPPAASPTIPPDAVAEPDPQPSTIDTRQIGEKTMANIDKTMEEAMKIDGALGIALADYESGLCLGTAGGGARLNLEVAAAGNCQVVKAKMNTMAELGIRGQIQDILITLDDQIHLIRPLRKYDNLFIYLAIDKAKGNLGMARHRLTKIESELVI